MKKLLIGLLALGSVSCFAQGSNESARDLIIDNIVRFQRCHKELACESTKEALLRVIAQEDQRNLTASLEEERDKHRGMARANLTMVLDDVRTLEVEIWTAPFMDL